MTVSLSLSHLPPRGLLDVHPQPVDFPAGRSQVALQLQLPLAQSETLEILNIKTSSPAFTTMNAGEKAVD